MFPMDLYLSCKFLLDPFNIRTFITIVINFYCNRKPIYDFLLAIVNLAVSRTVSTSYIGIVMGFDDLI